MGNRQSRKLTLQLSEEAAWNRVRTEPRLVRDHVHARGIGLRRLQLIVTPSFENVSVWEIWQAHEWQLIHPRVVEIEPDLRVVGHDRVPLASTLLAEYFERVCSITVPLRPDMSGSGGLDGTLYELALYGDLFSHWCFQWWSEAPAQWHPLVKLAEEMHACFTVANHPGTEPVAPLKRPP